METKYIVAGFIFLCVILMFIYSIVKFRVVIIDRKNKPSNLNVVCSGHNVTNISYSENYKLRLVVKTFLESEDALARDSYFEYMHLKSKAIHMSSKLSIKLRNTA